jgi:hypothetical protein
MAYGQAEEQMELSDFGVDNSDLILFIAVERSSSSSTIRIVRPERPLTECFVSRPAKVVKDLAVPR